MSITYSCGHTVSVSRFDEVHNLYPPKCPICGAPMFPDVELPEVKSGELTEQLKAGEVADTVSKASRRKWRGSND